MRKNPETPGAFLCVCVHEQYILLKDKKEINKKSLTDS